MATGEPNSLFWTALALLGVVAGLVSAFFAGWTAQLANTGNRAAKSQAVADRYTALRNRYFDVERQLPAQYRSAGYHPTVDSAEWKLLKAYWYHSFDEWFQTQVVDREVCGKLWGDFFAEAVCSALEKDSLRQVFQEMRTREFNTGVRAEFAAAVELEFKRRHPENKVDVGPTAAHEVTRQD